MSQAISNRPTMLSVAIETFQSYVAWVEDTDLLHHAVLYRGQAVRRGLLPGVARKDSKVNTTTVERKVLDQFKLRGASLLKDIEEGSLQLLVVAQHYGLKTRLLDWSANPLVALYFACADQNAGDAYVYVLKADTLITTDVYESDPFAAPRTRVFQPPWNNPRILAQQGWFTLHRHSVGSKKFVALERNKDTQKHLTELRIPVAKREGMLATLAKLTIGPETLVPDLTGLTRFLNHKHRLV